MLRAYNATRGNLANGNFAALASTLATLNWDPALNPQLDNIPVPVFTAGSVLRYNGFPENFIYTNPQFTGATMNINMNNANYHSMQAQFTMRATRGLYFSGTYTWSRNLGALSHPDIRYRDDVRDYGLTTTHRAHTFVMNGTYELPFGPNKWLFSDVNPVVGKIIGGWQFSWIHTMESGQPFGITSSARVIRRKSPQALRVSSEINTGHASHC